MLKSILFVGDYPNPVDKYRNVFFQNLIFAMADKGIHCVVISPVSYTHYKSNVFRIPKTDEHVTANGNTIEVYYPKYISCSSKRIGKWNTGKLTERNYQLIVRKTARELGQEFDCAYGHFFLCGGLAAVAVGRELGIPTFIAFGECDFESQVRCAYGDVSEADLQGLTGIISVSTDNSNELKTMKVFDPYPVLLAPNGVDLSLFHPMDKEKCRKELGIPQDIFVAGFVGGFIERKGDKRVLAAINQIEGVYGAFAGKGDAPTGHKIVFCNSMKHEKIPTFLNACDIFVLPTLAEGSCNAIIEAMACGLPIISSNLPFNDDVLTDNNSIRIDPMSIGEIKDAIEKLYNNIELRDMISKESLNTVKKLSIDERSNKISLFIESIISRK